MPKPNTAGLETKTDEVFFLFISTKWEVLRFNSTVTLLLTVRKKKKQNDIDQPSDS